MQRRPNAAGLSPRAARPSGGLAGYPTGQIDRDELPEVKGMKVVVISSTGGSVLNATPASGWVKSKIVEIVSDRHCGAIASAARHGVDHYVHATSSGAAFSDFLLGRYANRHIDLFISFLISEFSPNLDFDLAIDFSDPFPASQVTDRVHVTRPCTG